MTPRPKITIITATYYRPDLLARAIKSVQQSTFKEYEHIIVSDHCPKARQVYELFKDDKKIKFLDQESPHIHNHGARAHNLAIRKAQTDLFVYLNDDNIIMPNFIEIMYKGLSIDGYDVVHTKTHEINLGRGNHTIQKILSRNFAQDLDPEIYVPHELRQGAMDTSNVGHTRNIYEEIGEWKLTGECHKGIEDSEFFNRLIPAAKGRQLNVPIYTCVYYARGACFNLDKVYHDQVCSLDQDEIFVFPELLKQTGVL